MTTWITVTRDLGHDDLKKKEIVNTKHISRVGQWETDDGRDVRSGASLTLLDGSTLNIAESFDSLNSFLLPSTLSSWEPKR